MENKIINEKVELPPKELSDASHWVDRIVEGAEKEAIELGMDEFEIMRLAKRRGKDWCLKELKQYDNKN